VDERLLAIQARCEAATPGPWKVIEKGNTVPSVAVVSVAYDTRPQETICPNMSTKTDNADFIAHARQDIPYLLALLAERDGSLLTLRKEVTTLAIESLERMRELAKLEAEIERLREAKRCNGCAFKHTVGCHCARATWRDPLPAAPEEGAEK